MYNVFKCFTLCINCLLLFSDLQSQDMKIHHKNMFSKITTVSMLWPLFFFSKFRLLIYQGDNHVSEELEIKYETCAARRKQEE